jgi:hypothetical protein
MTGHGAKFGRKMELAIAALVTRPNIEDAARAAGVGEKTLRRWMREPEFNAEYLRARREGVHQAVARMQQATGVAGTIILKLMTDPNVPAAVRLRAAESVFGHAIKGIELEDIEARLGALERSADEQNPAKSGRFKPN